MKTVDTRPELLYHGTPMDPEPVRPQKLSLKTAAILLVSGNAVGVELAPGDGTAYRLFVAPAWPPHYRAAAGPGLGTEPTDALIVSLGFGLGSMHPLRRGAHPSYIQEKMAIRTGWTARLLAWWLDRLWAEMDAVPLDPMDWDALAEDHGR